MSHTLQTAIVFPVVLSGLIFFVSSGPVLYYGAATAASFEIASIKKSLDNHQIYCNETILFEGATLPCISTSPERMYTFVRAIEDSGTILIEGVTS